MTARRTHAANARERGFTLIEVLVAFTIAAILLTALMQGFSRGLRGIVAAEAQLRLIEHARNILADVGTRIPLETGLESGEDAGLRWRAEIAPAARDGAVAEQAEALGLRLFAVEVEVRDTDGRAQRLHTLRLAEIGS